MKKFLLFIFISLVSLSIKAQEFNYAQTEQRHTLYTSNVLIHHTPINQRGLGLGYAYFLDTSGSFRKMISIDFGVSDEMRLAVQTSTSLRFDMILELNDYWKISGRYHFNMGTYNHRKVKSYARQNFDNDFQLIFGRYTSDFFVAATGRVAFSPLNPRISDYNATEMSAWWEEDCLNRHRFPYHRPFRGWGHWGYSLPGIYLGSQNHFLFFGLIGGYTYKKLDIIVSPEWLIREFYQRTRAFIDVRVMLNYRF